MNAITINCAGDEAAWIAARKSDVTSTQSAALFGIPCYGTTELGLWHEKAQGVEIPFTPNERTKWGNRLESAIAYGIAEDNGWTIEPMKDYMRLPELRMGSSFDYVITNHPCGHPVHLEIKNVDGLAFKDGWIVHDDGEIEASPLIEMQVQHQMGVSGFPMAIIGALVGGNTTKLIVRERDEELIAAIKQRIAEFWQSVDAGIPPAANYPLDNETVLRLNSTATDGKIFDASNVAVFASLALEYQSLKQQAKDAETKAETIKAKMFAEIGEASKVQGPWGSISTGMVRGTDDKIITADMIGQTIKGRAGYRNFRVYMKKG